jgi:hypothetical protein
LVVWEFYVFYFTEIREDFPEVTNSDVAGEPGYLDEELIVFQVLGLFYGGFGANRFGLLFGLGGGTA